MNFQTFAIEITGDFESIYQFGLVQVYGEDNSNKSLNQGYRSPLRYPCVEAGVPLAPDLMERTG